MRKTGKYECKAKGIFANMKAPKTPADAKKEMRNVLLQTYFTSLVSLVLCVSLFLGTSYAWFTSEVTQTGNQIYVGTLDVGLYKGTGDTKVDMAVAKEDKSHMLFNPNIVWNPGYTMVETLEIKNKGTLDLKYVLGFGDGALANAGDGRTLDTVTQQFDVWVRAGAEKPASFAEVTEAKGWHRAGTIREILAGAPVATAELAKDQTATYTIAVHMSEGAGSALMGAQLSLSVKLIAYQKVEGSGAVTAVSNIQNLRTAAANGEDIILTGNINLNTANERITMNGGVLDGAKKKITYSGDKVDGNSAGVVTTNGGMVSNLVIEAGSNGRALYVTDLASDLAVTDCTFSGTYSFNINSANKTDKVVRFTSCYLNNWTSYANVASRVDFVGCTFGDVLKPYGDTVLTGCTFSSGEKKGLDVTALEEGETITLVNCTYKGKVIDRAVLTCVGGSIVITGTDLLVVNQTNSTYPLALK